jgi:uncharacterized membrane protein
MRSSASLLTRALEPLAAGLWVFFVLLSFLVGVIWAFGLGDAQLARWVLNRELFRTLQWLLQHLDFAWITLAALNGYVCLATREGLGTARRWGLMIVGATLALAWISTRTGFPLGPIQYGRMLGATIGSVPLGLPLFWFSIIIGAREALLRFFPRWSHAQIALGTGALGALTDASLEPLAAKLRGFWFWRSAEPTLPPVFDAPLTGYLAWGLLSGLLAFALREKSVVASARPRSWEPVVTLAIFHAIFLAAHLGRWVRS